MIDDFDVLRDLHAGPNRYFEDFELGERFYIPSRTMTEALFAAFQLASGDNDPIHYDVNYCHARGHKHLLAHGMQVMIQSAAGAGTFPQQVAASLLGMIELSGRVLKPVYAGDTLYPRLTIAGLKPQNTTGIITLKAEIWNQDSVQVFEGEHSYLIRKREPEG
ncbi:MaoC family dehydratase [Lutimaribacter marinistellae]|uniref:MaoC family dehydratase n=1 Tax=Lutimaribacter marinistellae TaxID=1820329 RepID=A0ABV7THB3_9RHOB